MTRMRQTGLVSCVGSALLLALSLPRSSHAIAPATLSGRWVMAQVTTTVARVPIVGSVYATSRLVSLHVLRHEHERLFGEGRLCTLSLDSGSRFVHTSLSSATKARLPSPRLDARLGLDARGQLTIHQDKQVVVVGARLENTLLDPLPQRSDDPRVFDEEGDGRPGMTVEVGGILSGSIYVAQRSWTELSGTLVGKDGFAGALRFGNEQVVLKATSRRLGRRLDTKPVPERSWFRMARLLDTADCEVAEDLAASWFD